MTLTITGIKELQDLTNDIVTKYPYEVVVEITEEVYKQAKKNIIPHSRPQGQLETNLDKRVYRNPSRGEVYIDDSGMLVHWRGQPRNYAIFVHFGTAPHDITPKNKKALRWNTVGGFAFAKKVEHPGYKGDPFMTKAAQTTFTKLDQIFTRVYDGL